MKDYYVVFNKNGGARLERSIKKAEELSKELVTIKNPDLSKVAKISPSYWKFVDGEVHPMTEEEQAIVNAGNKISNSVVKIIKSNEADLFVKKEQVSEIVSEFENKIESLKAEFSYKLTDLKVEFKSNYISKDNKIKKLAESLERSEASFCRKLRVFAAIVFAASVAVAYILIKVGV